MVEFGTSSAFRGWVRVRDLGYGFGVKGRKVKSRDCALASDLVRALVQWFLLAPLEARKQRRRAREARGAQQYNGVDGYHPSRIGQELF